jgi:hypothetical protein
MAKFKQAMDSEDTSISNIYISSFLGRFTSDFLGVFSCDNIPSKINEKNKFIIICNLSKKFEKGSHFICIVSSNDSIIYIDPLGLPCLNKYIIAFLIEAKKNVLYNSNQIQSRDSVCCGFYVILFALYFDTKSRQRNMKMTFSQVNLSDNDNICIQYIADIISMRTIR